jgi:hypothetical protein
MQEVTSKIIGEVLIKIVTSLTLMRKYSTINKVKNNKSISKKRYSQLVSLMFGFLMLQLEKLKDKEITEAMQFSVHMLNEHLSKSHSDFFEGIDFMPNNQGGYSQLNSDICKWYIDNFNNKSVKKIRVTGTHLFLLFVGKGSISDQNYENLKKDGTLLAKDSDYNLLTALNEIFLKNENTL